MSARLGHNESQTSLYIYIICIDSEFKNVLELGGPLEVTDNAMLRIFMLLPETIRRGIKRTGGLKAYLEQSDAFDVRGDLVGLPGQIKRTPITIQPPPGRVSLILISLHRLTLFYACVKSRTAFLGVFARSYCRVMKSLEL